MKFSNSVGIKEYREKLSGGLPKKSKYNTSNKIDRTWTGLWRGRSQTIIFDSKAEMTRFLELRMVIGDEFSIQERFVLKDGQSRHDRIEYVADFYYKDLSGKWTVEDVKGVRTQVYILKKKLFIEKYPNINFVEVF